MSHQTTPTFASLVQEFFGPYMQIERDSSGAMSGVNPRAARLLGFSVLTNNLAVASYFSVDTSELLD